MSALFQMARLGVTCSSAAPASHFVRTFASGAPSQGSAAPGSAAPGSTNVLYDVASGTYDAAKDALAAGTRVVGDAAQSAKTQAQSAYDTATTKEVRFEERPPPATHNNPRGGHVDPAEHGEKDPEEAGLVGHSRPRAGAAQHDKATEPIGGVDPEPIKPGPDPQRPRAGAAQHEASRPGVPGAGANVGAGPGR